MTASIATARAANDIAEYVSLADLLIDAQTDPATGEITYGVCHNAAGDLIAEIIRFETEAPVSRSYVGPVTYVGAWRVARGAHVRNYGDEPAAVAAILNGAFGW